MLKLLVGILKGAVIGAALGYGANRLGWDSFWLTYGLIGAIVGLFVGKPIWRLLLDKDATMWVSILKSAFGFGIGVGLWALVTKALHLHLAVDAIPTATHNVFLWGPSLGGAIGAVYGGFVELDDAIGDGDKNKAKAAPAQKKSPPNKTEK
ncbi:MAG TPA: hypothetical protein VGM90_36295 [Kofleriaceae bacterium]